MIIFFELFYTFFKIGLFGFGGGYGMLSLIQGEVVTQHDWISAQEFTDIVAISQMTPGPIGINSATYIGYTAVTNAGYSTGLGILGSCLATSAVVLPSFILMIIISRYFLKYQNSVVINSIFNGLKPAVVGLLAAAALILMDKDNFGSPHDTPYQFYISVGIFIITFISTYKFKINPIKMILIMGVVGFLVY